MPSIQLAVSNIAWNKADDELIYTAMKNAASPAWNWPPPASSPNNPTTT